MALTPHKQFSENLLALSSAAGSIANVCRELKINRQQFNKYLAGGTLPTEVTLLKFSKYFHVEPDMFFRPLEGGNSSAIESPHAKYLTGLINEPMITRAAISGALTASQNCSLPEGVYSFYGPWLPEPEFCVRGTIFIARRNEVMLFTRVSQLVKLDKRYGRAELRRHDGIVMEVKGKLSFVSRERRNFNIISALNIDASNLIELQLLSGLFLTFNPSGVPHAGQIVLVYEGNKSKLKENLKYIGIVKIDSPYISERVKQLLQQFSTTQSVLQAADLFADWRWM